MDLNDRLRKVAETDRSGPWLLRIGGGAVAVIVGLAVLVGVLLDALSS